jgi:hypothetical protein
MSSLLEFFQFDLQGKASPSTYEALVDARARDYIRASGGHTSYTQARAIVEPEVRRGQAAANADAEKHAVLFGSENHTLLLGAIGLGVLAALMLGGKRMR